MKIICPKCHQETEISTSNAVDELGEVFICRHCRWPFRYAKE